MDDEITNTGSGGGVNYGNAYAASFGDMPDNTRYQELDIDGFQFKSDLTKLYNTDMREHLQKAVIKGQQVVQKALTSTTGGAGTAGFALVPVYVDPRIVDQTRRYTPLIEIFPRVTNMGRTADFNNITAKGGAFTRAEDAALSETNTTFLRFSTEIKYLYSVGRVTGQAVATIPSYILAGFTPAGGDRGAFGNQNASNAKQLNVLVKSREIRELEENLLINGNATTSFLAANPDTTEFDGITVIMGSTNTVDKNTTALTLTDINSAVQLAFDDSGRPNLGIADSASYTDLLELLSAKIGFLQSTQQVYWGFSTIVMNTMVGQIPIIPSQFLSTASGAKSIYLLDMTVWEMRVLQDLTYEDLAKLADAEKFLLKVYEAVINRNPSFSASITEIL